MAVPHPLPVAVLPENPPAEIIDAVLAGGGTIVPAEQAEALVLTAGDAAALGAALRVGRNVSWVQLPSAGIESYVDLLDADHIWTCAKGIYGPSVAEHALALALAGIHHLPHCARTHTWSPYDYRPLLGGNMVIVGGGGIAEDLVTLLQPFHAAITVVRRHTREMAGVARVVPPDHLLDVLPDADVVVLAPALTPETRGMIGADQLRAMKETAWLVNVGRGGLVQTDALVDALKRQEIGGAGLDVTDPEPLPDDHPLWALDTCLITPHIANPPEYQHAALAHLIEENVRRRRQGEPLRGVVDVELGY